MRLVGFTNWLICVSSGFGLLLALIEPSKGAKDVTRHNNNIQFDPSDASWFPGSTLPNLDELMEDGNWTGDVDPDIPTLTANDVIHPLPENWNWTSNDEDGITIGRASCECGRPSRRIVGGQAASISEYPWTAALTRYGSRPYCGGTLINDLYVVTASHCVDGMSATSIGLHLNQETVFNSPNVQKFGVSRITMHPNYDRRSVNNDIALLRLSRRVNLDRPSALVPVCVPSSNANDFKGYQATVAGWGAMSQGTGGAASLRKVTIPVLGNPECNRDTRYVGRITENQLCAGDLEAGGRDSCQGDSGGPLIIENGGRRTLIGIVSWGYGCAAPRAPGVYTRVGRYPSWILQNTPDSSWCQG